MAFYLKGLLWLGVLGGALTGIGLPTNNAVQSILNRQQVRKTGWHTQAGRDYESYWYGAGGFGDARDKQVQNNRQWETEFNNVLTGIRSSWGKQNVGKGLEKGFHNWLKNKKKICENGNSSNGCYVGKMEFIDNKGETLYGRIPVRDSKGKHNLYVKWQKCKAGAKASAIWQGKKKSESNNTASASESSQQTNQYKWCFEEAKVTK
ncbi:hypothetical protein [Candidatus Mycoplasma haematominutum]|uniref:Uncharacterized protein n=1 Tax=Candidatus Mycoplasma haematominutum 'Birmingham 1' TaxID=1116213 RepID=G8C2S9_9MOLU|nr:hypothetical protein [Candidatus Mycoplasma haematominutum]CCE66627.1 hypothetical protein MHM_01090 [Candidatus Mycoplasma haematominutum 'Birmingham 1']